MKKILDLNELEDVQVERATSWSFYFEGERYFEGTWSFLTAGGIEKPLLNAYRALARLGEHRVAATSDAAHSVTLIDGAGGRSMPEEIDALASRSDSGTVAMLVWRHTDDQHQVDDAAAQVTVEVAGLDCASYTLTHLRIDAGHSNSHSAWVAAGSPQLPTPEQLAAIRARQGLEELEPARQVEVTGSTVTLAMSLPLPAVSLLVLEPVR